MMCDDGLTWWAKQGDWVFGINEIDRDTMLSIFEDGLYCTPGQALPWGPPRETLSYFKHYKKDGVDSALIKLQDAKDFLLIHHPDETVDLNVLGMEVVGGLLYRFHFVNTIEIT